MQHAVRALCCYEALLPNSLCVYHMKSELCTVLALAQMLPVAGWLQAKGWLPLGLWLRVGWPHAGDRPVVTRMCEVLLPSWARVA